ncbi:putative FKBP-type peptidyl-prolyl cis-trans isomerase FkpA [Neolewinella maritima]|uniref:Peptidyl-prolyl cis-trans isomerase n=1 Tax=Neolewinella maritima TaxID=1383882 RepID=A0ABM9AXF3_9BACT|nr:FKBP-type peptidyl-prolyl cis-trans isomerase [Neolewinella maritima]CAH0998891.1 putative FKBP-type peptidyl-prolyl cis-trans isomerase FkpA [Neolewinella maritima]
MKKPTKAKLRQRSADRTAFALQQREAFLAGELEVTYTDSGLGYVLHAEGEGAQPRAGKNVEVHYVGMLKDKPEVFDESFGNIRGARFVLGTGQVIPGWDEGIALLQWGDEATLIIPSKLGYGPKGRGQGIPSNSDLLFYVEIASVG